MKLEAQKAMNYLFDLVDLMLTPPVALQAIRLNVWRPRCPVLVPAVLGSPRPVAGPVVIV